MPTAPVITRAFWFPNTLHLIARYPVAVSAGSGAGDDNISFFDSAGDKWINDGVITGYGTVELTIPCIAGVGTGTPLRLDMDAAVVQNTSDAEPSLAVVNNTSALTQIAAYTPALSDFTWTPHTNQLIVEPTSAVNLLSAAAGTITWFDSAGHGWTTLANPLGDGTSRFVFEGDPVASLGTPNTFSIDAALFASLDVEPVNSPAFTEANGPYHESLNTIPGICINNRGPGYDPSRGSLPQIGRAHV